ncbi:MAG: vWA domain-containing protein [Polyangiaceae bacterium]
MNTPSRSTLLASSLLTTLAGLALIACSDNREGVTIQGGNEETESGGLRPDPSLPPEGSSGGGDVGLIGNGGDDGADEESCLAEVIEATAIPPVIQFVVDTSGSMNWVAGTERNPEQGERSKWEITALALDQAINRMPDLAAVGFSYYPNQNPDGETCFNAQVGVPIAALSSEQRDLVERANAAVTPLGGTPTHAAYAYGLRQLLDSDLPGAKFMLLITDGIPTYTLECSGNGRDRVDGQPLIEAVTAAAADDDVRTFVIGSPGSEEARAELSEMASLGQTARVPCSDDASPFCHFDMTTEPDFADALSRALGEITNVAVGCDYAVPPPPPGLQLLRSAIRVWFEDSAGAVTEFSQDAAGDCASGWQLSNDGRSLHLCPSSCDVVQSGISAANTSRLQIRLECTAIPK